MISWLVTLAALAAALTLFVRWLEPRFAFFPFRGESETPRDYGVPYEPVTIATSDGERLRAWVMHAPSPRARIVYFHGNGGNLSNWAPILSAIVQRGFSMIAVDYRGYGLSTGRPTERGLYRDVEAVVRHVRAEADPAVPLIYWGRSLGATMAAYAASIDAADGVILESSFPNARAAVRGSPVLFLLSLVASYRFPTTGFMKTVRAPALVMHGDRDGVIPFALGREVFDAIDGPREFVALRGGDHNDLAPADEAYWLAVDRFVERLRR